MRHNHFDKLSTHHNHWYANSRNCGNIFDWPKSKLTRSLQEKFAILVKSYGKVHTSQHLTVAGRLLCYQPLQNFLHTSKTVLATLKQMSFVQ